MFGSGRARESAAGVPTSPPRTTAKHASRVSARLGGGTAGGPHDTDTGSSRSAYFSSAAHAAAHARPSGDGRPGSGGRSASAAEFASGSLDRGVDRGLSSSSSSPASGRGRGAGAEPDDRRSAILRAKDLARRAEAEKQRELERLRRQTERDQQYKQATERVLRLERERVERLQAERERMHEREMAFKLQVESEVGGAGRHRSRSSLRHSGPGESVGESTPVSPSPVVGTFAHSAESGRHESHESHESREARRGARHTGAAAGNDRGSHGHSNRGGPSLRMPREGVGVNRDGSVAGVPTPPAAKPATATAKRTDGGVGTESYRGGRVGSGSGDPRHSRFGPGAEGGDVGGSRARDRELFSPRSAVSSDLGLGLDIDMDLGVGGGEVDLGSDDEDAYADFSLGSASGSGDHDAHGLGLHSGSGLGDILDDDDDDDDVETSGRMGEFQDTHLGDGSTRGSEDYVSGVGAATSGRGETGSHFGLDIDFDEDALDAAAVAAAAARDSHGARRRFSGSDLPGNHRESSASDRTTLREGASSSSFSHGEGRRGVPVQPSRVLEDSESGGEEDDGRLAASRGGRLHAGDRVMAEVERLYRQERSRVASQSSRTRTSSK